ncbi:hypothetical protein BDV3_000977 [Batrachochytrium dendrobatidis]
MTTILEERSSETNDNHDSLLKEFVLQPSSERKWKPDLDDIFFHGANTAIVKHSWELLRELVRFKVTTVIQDRIHEDQIDPASTPSIFEMEERIMEALESLSSAPFTYQRLCELIIHPRLYHKTLEKYLRAVEKVLLVASYTPDTYYTPAPLSSPAEFRVPPTDGQSHIPGPLAYSFSTTYMPVSATLPSNSAKDADVSDNADHTADRDAVCTSTVQTHSINHDDPMDTN